LSAFTIESFYYLNTCIMLQKSVRSNVILKPLVIVILFGLLFSCQKGGQWPPKATEESADVVIGWYRFIEKLQRPLNPQPSPLAATRNFAYIGVGLYEAVSPGIKGSKSLSSKLYQMPEMPSIEKGQDYLWSATANAALASMFKKFLPGLTDANKASIDSFENANNERFSLVVFNDVLVRSQTFGRAIADAIFTWSTTDNFMLGSPGYVPPVFDGAWVPTPPAFANPTGAFLKDSRPFLESSLTYLAPPIPVAYSTDVNSDFYKAVKDVYDVNKGLTTEQKAIADWFADAGGPGVGEPAPYHLLSIITGMLESKHAKLGQAAEVYAKTGIAGKEGPINIFRSKFHYSLLRPVTYIQAHIDANWLPYLITPPYPEYPSGLAGLYTPMIQVLIREFGDVPVTDNTYDWRGTPARHYASLTKLVEEAAVSRVYGGIHYRFTQNATLVIGKELGNKIADIKLSGGPK
jgi:hypothetical protein